MTQDMTRKMTMIKKTLLMVLMLTVVGDAVAKKLRTSLGTHATYSIRAKLDGKNWSQITPGDDGYYEVDGGIVVEIVPTPEIGYYFEVSAGCRWRW